MTGSRRIPRYGPRSTPSTASPSPPPHRSPADAAALAVFDETLAELAGTVPLSRFRQRARRLRTRLEPPETTTARHQRAHTTRRLILEPAPDGMAWISLSLSAVDAAAIHARVTATATHQSGQADETRTLDQLRADTATNWLTGHNTPTLKHHTKFRVTRTPNGTITWHTPTGHTATTTPQHPHPPRNPPSTPEHPPHHYAERSPEPERYPEPAPF
ncbi:DUF222 domain-containing protein [Agromyces soli]|uniref:DUF222 domain-containing protein n=1 Tax=Agromyces soli TaxID=659012 RepID=UPI0031D09293